MKTNLDSESEIVCRLADKGHGLLSSLSESVFKISKDWGSKSFHAYEEIKSYLDLRVKDQQKVGEIIEFINSKGRQKLYSSKILSNWKMKRVIRDIDLICLAKGCKSKCVVDRTIPPSRECNSILKSMTIKLSESNFNYTEMRKPLFIPFTFDLDLDDSDLTKINIYREDFVRESEYIEKYEREKMNLKMEKNYRERDETLKEMVSKRKKHTFDKLKLKEAMNYLAAVKSNNKIVAKEIKRAPKFVKTMSISNLLKNKVEECKSELVKKSYLYGYFEDGFKTPKNKARVCKNYKDDSTMIKNYYECLNSYSPKEESSSVLDSISFNYLKLASDFKRKNRNEVKDKFTKKKNKKKLKNIPEKNVNIDDRMIICPSLKNINKLKSIRESKKILRVINDNDDEKGFNAAFKNESWVEIKKLKEYFNICKLLNELNSVAIKKMSMKSFCSELEEPKFSGKGISDCFYIKKFLEVKEEEKMEGLSEILKECYRNINHISGYLKLREECIKEESMNSRQERKKTKSLKKKNDNLTREERKQKTREKHEDFPQEYWRYY